jgi:hypothetical protein
VKGREVDGLDFSWWLVSGAPLSDKLETEHIKYFCNAQLIFFFFFEESTTEFSCTRASMRAAWQFNFLIIIKAGFLLNLQNSTC